MKLFYTHNGKARGGWQASVTVVRAFVRRVQRLLRAVLTLLLVSAVIVAGASTAPPSRLSTLTLALDTAKHVFTATHFKPIGLCVWLDHGKFGVPYLATTLELDEHLPDLVVTSFNQKNDDPWWLAHTTLDPVSYAAGDTTVRASTGNLAHLGNAPTPASNDGLQGNGVLLKYVDVIGNPDPLAYFPFISLRLDTRPLLPYYSSAADTPGRLGVAEAIRLVQSLDVFHYFIGKSFTDKWGYEFPREMSVSTSNDYEAAVIAALRAADIVTNQHVMHVVHGVSDSCGKNCAVAAVTESSGDHVLWQEVYPHEHFITIGQSEQGLGAGHELGEADDKAGNGNYVFVLWREYKGCVQHSGKLLWASINVPTTEKR